MRLRSVAVAVWGPLVFANLDAKAPSLEDILEDIPHRVEPFACQSMQYVMRKQYELACNWKVYVDNYLEGYHIPVVHPALHKEIDYDAYHLEPYRYSSIQHAPLRPLAGAATDRRYDPAAATVPEAVYGWVFPNLMENVYMGQMQTNVVVPVSHERTVVVFEWYASRPPADPATDPTWMRLVEFSDEIQDEDVEICEAVQRNLRSRVYDRGRYSVKREQGVHHFHSLLHEFLT
jgi:choline monooxygenase